VTPNECPLFAPENGQYWSKNCYNLANRICEAMFLEQPEMRLMIY